MLPSGWDVAVPLSPARLHPNTVPIVGLPVLGAEGGRHFPQATSPPCPKHISSGFFSSCFVKHFVFLLIKNKKKKKRKKSEKCCLAPTHSPWLPEELWWKSAPALSSLIKLQQKHCEFQHGGERELVLCFFLIAMKIAELRCWPL